METGWIKLHRKIIDDAVWKCTTIEQRMILIYILLKANHNNNEWMWNGEKHIIKPGQFVTSLESIRVGIGGGISIKKIRTGIAKLQKLGFLANESTKGGRLITICKWDTYQGNKTEEGKGTGSQGANEWAPIKELKNVKNRPERKKFE